ncbi:flagellar assembly peptidoglycan hydrolase FlgJ [Vibrio agarivorans]|uniref:flagellar assembly peptidoglycan hydrolase FlgJ n=1 Tax=Vibrio agarivorans TaxID=153622 RepID=UPI00222E1E9F|nr:flagellar assembly peptidoglycan hydrolase FlgJ [Vibrio agarivorans]MDN3662757.1 flagellar assembly peptidoglycan hydrolase FlgJ [Vibrio agarivorans]
MINNGNDIGFIHDISGLDRLRQSAVEGSEGDEKAALTAAAKQFEAIFTSMLFKSMRDANADFESDLMNSQNQSFYRQMLDEQMASEMSANGSLGLADMIVAQLSTGSIENQNAAAPQENFEEMMQRVHTDKKIYAQNRVEQAEQSDTVKSVAPSTFDTPESFVSAMKPYADRAAKALGVDSSVLIAQAALETGWGQKVIQNGRGSSNNLFNIKADRSWQGDKMATQTLEYHSGVPVQERAAFRSYDSYQQSFDDYVQFLERNPRYTTALENHQGDSETFMRGIHQAGYATDPRYVDKVMSVKKRIDQM